MQYEQDYMMQCDGFPCDRLWKFKDCHVVNGISHHEHIMEQIRRQREIGIDAWVREQEKIEGMDS